MLIELNSYKYDIIYNDIHIIFPTKNCCIKYIHELFPNQFCDKFLLEKLDIENNMNILLQYSETERLENSEKLVFPELEWNFLKNDIIKEDYMKTNKKDFTFNEFCK